MNTHMHPVPIGPNHVSSYSNTMMRINALAEPISSLKPISLARNDPRRNHLLAGLPEAQLVRLLPHLEPVDLHVGQVICQVGSRSQHVYFPTTAIVSLTYEMEDGLAAEMTFVGNEGMVGIGLFMAGETMPGLAKVLCAGRGFRLSSQIVKEEFNRSAPLQHALLRYLQVFIVEIAQIAVCNRHHTISQQLCRFLLLYLDRSPSSANEIALTQEMIAASLGVRRESVTEAAGKLRAKDIIDYNRGHIAVLDLDGLELQACECYAIVKKTFNRLLPRREVQSTSRSTQFSIQSSAYSTKSNPYGHHAHAIDGLSSQRRRLKAPHRSLS